MPPPFRDGSSDDAQRLLQDEFTPAPIAAPVDDSGVAPVAAPVGDGSVAPVVAPTGGFPTSLSPSPDASPVVAPVLPPSPNFTPTSPNFAPTFPPYTSPTFPPITPPTIPTKSESGGSMRTGFLSVVVVLGVLGVATWQGFLAWQRRRERYLFRLQNEGASHVLGDMQMVPGNDDYDDDDPELL